MAKLAAPAVAGQLAVGLQGAGLVYTSGVASSRHSIKTMREMLVAPVHKPSMQRQTGGSVEQALQWSDLHSADWSLHACADFFR